VWVAVGGLVWYQPQPPKLVIEGTAEGGAAKQMGFGADSDLFTWLGRNRASTVGGNQLKGQHPLQDSDLPD
jgi:hypothetical protein